MDVFDHRPIGIGSVRIKTPERAQQPPMIFPSSVSGLRSYPTVVRVIRPHQNDSTKVQL